MCSKLVWDLCIENLFIFRLYKELGFYTNRSFLVFIVPWNKIYKPVFYDSIQGLIFSDLRIFLFRKYIYRSLSDNPNPFVVTWAFFSPSQTTQWSPSSRYKGFYVPSLLCHTSLTDCTFTNTNSERILLKCEHPSACSGDVLKPFSSGNVAGGDVFLHVTYCLKSLCCGNFL